jgi:hypothetical protein
MSLEAQETEKSDDFVMDLMETILSADTFDDIFAAQDAGMLSGKDFCNRPFYLSADGVSYKRSTKEGGLPFYAMLNVTEVATGETVTINCGGKTFLAVLHALLAKGYFDASEENPLGRAVVLIGTESENGAYLSLRPYVVAKAKASAKK